MVNPAVLLPEVTDKDLDWIRDVMELHEIDQSRQEFLCARETLDVSACPGSGKTTLIVAKLAIMARKWPHRTRGICVLSHTNAARAEIQRRLRGTVVGQQLLSYPHFIDTIHSFVNRFLALPWLYSHGYPAPTVDDDVTTAYRRRALGESDYRKVEYSLQKKYSGFDQIRLKDRNLHFDLGDRPFPAKPDTPTYKTARQAVEASAEAGYFCYDEMFIWANALLEDCPNVSTWLQRRFPLVMIDEMQDTSGLQAGILDALFRHSGSEVALQRVGDPNQAIFDGVAPVSSLPGAYPDSSMCLEIPKSFRFDKQIASLASPFAVIPVGPEGLQGAGPRLVRDAPESCSNAVFIFPDASTEGVLDVYGQHVLATFSDSALNHGTVAAVGAVHKDESDIGPGHAHFPKTVPHYWSGYTAEIGRRKPHPRTLVQYVRVAQAVVRDERDLSPGVEKIASGLARLARRAGGGELLGRRAPTHRALIEILAPDVEARAAYRRLLHDFLVSLQIQTPSAWSERQDDILLVAAALNDSGTAPDPGDSFLRWDESDASLAALSASPHDVDPNVYRAGDGAGRSVDIRLGSIHSVKGQTHLATMLLNTFFRAHSMKRMLPWLLGEKVNLNGAGTQDRKRLLETYVAMTRPSHLLCLAVPKSAFGDDAALPKHIATLRDRGWAVADVIDGAPSWHI